MDFVGVKNQVCNKKLQIVLGMDYVILLWHSQSLPYNYSGILKKSMP